MSVVRRLALPAGFVVMALALAGCFGRSERPDFYTLSGASGPAPETPVATRPTLGLVVGPIDFPRYLDRPEIVTRNGAHELVVADAHRWGGSLRTDILRTVADDLGSLLGTARVAMYPFEPSFKADYRVLLDIREFESTAGGAVVLRVRWTVVAMKASVVTKDGTAVAVEESRIEQTPASASIADIVAAESAALAQVTHQIAERLATLPDGTP